MTEKTAVKKRVCIFGGSFDPVHVAHIHMAEQALAQFCLDEVIFMPTGTSYHKGHSSASAKHRNAIISLAISGRDNMSVSLLDQSRNGDTYTADTLAIYKKSHPSDELFFMMGADSLMHIQNWVRTDEIFNTCTVIAVDRPGIKKDVLRAHAENLKQTFHAKILFLENVFECVSSTHIRELAWNYCTQHDEASFKELCNLMTEPAAKYIIENKIYNDEDPWTEEEITEDLRCRLSHNRFVHTLGVADTAEDLAERWNIPCRKGRLAGLLHDCGKFLKGDEYIKRARMADIDLTDAELKNPSLIHAKLGEYYAKERYHITDKEILSAIRFHTTGRPDMTKLEEIVFVADYIEPNRDKAPNLEEFRKLAFEDLDKTVMLITQDTLKFLKDKDVAIDDTTLETYEWYHERYGKE